MTYYQGIRDTVGKYKSYHVIKVLLGEKAKPKQETSSGKGRSYTWFPVSLRDVLHKQL